MSRRLILLFVLSGLFRVQAAVEDELTFVRELTSEGFPNLARTALSRMLQQFPDAETSAPELRIRILIAEKKFDGAQTEISAIKDSAPLWLFLADTAYRARQFPAAETGYKNYFNSGVKADDAAMQAAFNYGELLEQRDEEKSARTLYENVLGFPGIGKSARPVKVKLARLLVGEDPERAKKLCEDVQLGGLDLWFGQAVVIWADVMIRKNEWSETQSVLETQLELLKQLEGVLEKQGQPVSLISPLAGARYLLGTCYEHAAKNDAALAQFYNVYAKYGDSEWGPRAQEKAQALKAFFEAQGKTVKIDLGANKAKMEESAFRVARRLFFDKQYTDAVPAYLESLNKYPEGDESITALRELTQSYISLNDPLGAKTIVAYTGERFAAREAAADALLAAGNRALDEKQNDLAWWIYDRYFEFFPRHPRAPAVLYTLSGLRKNEDYLFQCLENYPDSPYAARALSRLAWNAYEKENYPLAAERFENVLSTETDFEKKTRARFALAESYRFSEHWKPSLKNFQTLEKSLDKAAENSGEAADFGEPFLEKSVFYQGVCLAKLGEPENAVKAFDRFIEKFQGSEILPQAQLAKASAQMELRRYDDALSTLAVFDETGEQKFLEPALYYRGQALLETGRFGESIQCLETLLNSWPESGFYYEARLVQGRAYAANGQNTEAVRVLSDILDFTSDDLLLNRTSLELGRAQTDPAEKLASFQRVALLADPAKYSDLIADALFESLPLYLELNRPQDLLTDAARLEKDFPTIGKNTEIDEFRKKAEQQIQMLQKEEGQK